MKKKLLPALPVVALITALLMLLAGSRVSAQKEDTSRITIHVVNMETMTGIKTDTGEYKKFTGNVILTQGTDTLYCDSALQNVTTKNFEAFSNVRIAQQGGTNGTSDYLKYTSSLKQAFMSGNVIMTDGKNHLTSAELMYNMGTKVAVYDNGGKIYNDTTTVTSHWGAYNMAAKEARFKGNVVILDPQYKIRSEDVQYNTESKVTTFYARSVVTRDSGKTILETSDGWYDGKLGIAHFKGQSSTWNDGQYIQADSVLSYDKQTGHGLAIGKLIQGDTLHRVIVMDTVHHSKMYCGRAEYYQKQKKMWASIKPVLEQVNGKDTLYIAADTFYSAPMVRTRRPGSISKAADTAIHTAKDSVAAIAYDLPMPVPSSKFHVPVSKYDTGDVAETVSMKPGRAAKNSNKKNKKKHAPEMDQQIAVTDSATADTTAPLYFIGYHHVLIFSDSLQGKCDSVCYTRADSLIKMMYNPIAWAHKSQITGDTILMQLDSNTLRKLYVPNNALLVSQTGPEIAHLFDQIQGKTLTAYFKNNAINEMIVKPDAECIYYSKDEKGAYLGVCQASSVKMFIYFQDQKIKNIKFDKEPKQTLTPLEQADLPNMKLSKFKWLAGQRPQDKEELLDR